MQGAGGMPPQQPLAQPPGGAVVPFAQPSAGAAQGGLGPVAPQAPTPQPPLTAYSKKTPYPKMDLEEAVSSLQRHVEDAINFMESEIYPEIEAAEAFYDGETSLDLVEGRSQITDTVVRDVIRSLKPSIMRVFTQADEIVQYKPVDHMTGALADYQTRYANQLFWDHDGYSVLMDVVQDALLKKVGMMSSTAVERETYEFRTLKNIMPATFVALSHEEDVYVVSYEKHPNGSIDAEIAIVTKKTELVQEYVPLYEFFVNDSATCPEDARVIGQRQSVAVGDCIAMGLDADWDEMDDIDLESTEVSGESERRRGYVVDDKTGDAEKDPMMKTVLLTKVYARFDLAGLGEPQLYCFYLGGTSYEYIDHFREDETEYSRIVVDPQPGAFFGKSVFDWVAEDQDTRTSLLRATADNAHLSNNRRLAVNELMVNMDDVLDPRIGAPIRMRQPGMIQEIGVEPTVGSMLPLLKHLEEQTNNKVGVTQASMGLDPDALQSTDKEAVRNTIQLAQGQVELICRNIANYGLVKAFKRLLSLSITYKDDLQPIRLNDGLTMPISQRMFNPLMQMEVKVGIGTAGFDMKMAGLQATLQQQFSIIDRLGLDNPMVSAVQLYNTIADITAAYGLSNVNRYFNPISQEVAQMMQQRMEAKAQAQQPPDPSAGLVQAETIKAQSNAMVKKGELEQKTDSDSKQHRYNLVKLLMDDDLRRDEMAQQLEIEAAAREDRAVDKESVRAEQDAERENKRVTELIKQHGQIAQKRVSDQQKMMQQGQQGPQGQQGQPSPQGGGAPMMPNPPSGPAQGGR